jgi:phage shock protein B
MDGFTAILIVGMLFIGLPWLIFHYVTKWKQSASLTPSDENMIDDVYDTARRLEARMETIERIIAADDPNWKSGR